MTGAWPKPNWNLDPGHDAMPKAYQNLDPGHSAIKAEELERIKASFPKHEPGDSICSRCGKPYWVGSLTVHGTCQCTYGKPEPPSGWICPACGCGNAAWASKCGHCVPNKGVSNV